MSSRKLQQDETAEARGVSCPIPRLPNLAELDAELVAHIEQGANPIEVRQLGHAPELYKKFITFQTQMNRHGVINPRTREMARLRIAELNRCHY